MAKQYDINDPYDREILTAKYDMLSADEWEDYAKLAEKHNLGKKNINILNSSCKRAGLSKYVSPKVLVWVISLIDQIEDLEDLEGEE